ncbi:hypothetical protein A4X03_0g2085 [Tilletia caries]|uniref:FAD/NAD(P)-binding domain-containing protein n=1 Tax=Tilletia caries TaxID=13290 RepID=A0A8T8TP99_9BASI|nr:hypothetical protein A4X03_0g2085 [Tilletia caries]
MATAARSALSAAPGGFFALRRGFPAAVIATPSIGISASAFASSSSSSSSSSSTRAATRRTFTSNTTSSQVPPAQALVVGAGPAGVAATGILSDLGLASRPHSLIWADPIFNGGRVQERYREVPSNTKVHTFLDYARACEVFREIEARAGEGNAIGKLAELDQQKGCELGRAVDAVQVLIEGMLSRKEVKQAVGNVSAADWTADGLWKVTLDSGETFQTERIVLATGSLPRPSITPPGTSLTPLNLDDVLHPSTLHKVLPDPTKARIAVVGASHSAVLALRNLYNADVPHLVNFARSDLKYAIYKEGYILYDNTGLKGVAADWAKEYMEEGGAKRDLGRITRVRLPGAGATGPSEEEVYKEHLEGCTHILHGWGYDPRPIPRITASGLPGVASKGDGVEFDHDTGRFWWKGGREYVPRLFGCGIAFPARVTDPEGNVELAVGFIKFMKFLKNVGKGWAQALSKGAILEAQRASNASLEQRSGKYNFIKSYEGKTFFKDMMFFTGNDGSVDYVDHDSAHESGLIGMMDGMALMRAAPHRSGTHRSVRTSTDISFTEGLIILDILHGPRRLQLARGRRDRHHRGRRRHELQQVQHPHDRWLQSRPGPGDHARRQAHRGGGGGGGQNCDAEATSEEGCAISGTQNGDFGVEYNANHGGVPVLDWHHKTGIRIFFFPRGSVPEDIEAGHQSLPAWGVGRVTTPSGTAPSPARRRAAPLTQ